MPEGEFEFIARRLRPLATTPGALALTDDAALLDPAPGRQLVLTKDAMVAGVHFLPDDPPGQIAQKLLRVNLSDLAAMGAAPLGYLLALARPKEISDAWLDEFCAGLAADNADIRDRAPRRRYGLDTGAAHPVAHRDRRGADRRGAAAERRATRRRRLGLRDPGRCRARPQGPARRARRHGAGARLPDRALPPAAAAPCARPGAARHRERRDRCFGRSGRGPRAHSRDLRGRRRAACRTQLPLSAAARDLPGARDAALAGGDDYELLFTAPPKRRAEIAALARRLDLPLTRIGTIRADQGLHVLDEKGQELPVRKAGWQHF